MFDRESAEKRVAELINADYYDPEDELIIVSEETIEKDYGWIFFYWNRASRIKATSKLHTGMLPSAFRSLLRRVN